MANRNKPIPHVLTEWRASRPEPVRRNRATQISGVSSKTIWIPIPSSGNSETPSRNRVTKRSPGMIRRTEKERMERQIFLLTAICLPPPTVRKNSVRMKQISDIKSVLRTWSLKILKSSWRKKKWIRNYSNGSVGMKNSSVVLRRTGKRWLPRRPPIEQRTAIENATNTKICYGKYDVRPDRLVRQRDRKKTVPRMRTKQAKSAVPGHPLSWSNGSRHSSKGWDKVKSEQGARCLHHGLSRCRSRVPTVEFVPNRLR